MSNKQKPNKIKNVSKANIEGSVLDGIVEIESPEVLDAVAGGQVYGPPAPTPPPPPPWPPTTYPGQPPLPNSPAWGPYPSPSTR